MSEKTTPRRAGSSSSPGPLPPSSFEHWPLHWETFGERLWLKASEVCGILGIRNVSDACSRLDEDEVRLGVSETNGGEQQVRFVSESGMYQLTFVSRRPEAKRFRRWVTEEVLPSIRRTGGYQASPDTSQLSSDDCALLTYLRRPGRYLVVRREIGEFPLIQEEPDEAFLARVARCDVQGMVHAIGLVDSLWRTHVAYLEAGTISGDHVVALNRTIGIAAALGAGALALRPDREDPKAAISVPVRETRR
ncbi:hypothetical protein AA0472_1856 [Acetobacter estunensis NRIC 0472]|nr:BRO family protein [Acetobacter estunensis]GBQ25710.1 hypothetical protein AA0472_1856 [Acetobacter estunensis NRIC 0472]